MTRARWPPVICTVPKKKRGVGNQPPGGGLGGCVDVAPKLGLGGGLGQTGQFLKHCWFDREATQWLREGLSQYRADYDPVKGVMKLVPVHDKASHYADAMRTLATGNRNMLQGWGEQAAANFGV